MLMMMLLLLMMMIVCMQEVVIYGFPEINARIVKIIKTLIQRFLRRIQRWAKVCHHPTLDLFPLPTTIPLPLRSILT